MPSILPLDEPAPVDPRFDFRQFDGLSAEDLVKQLAKWQKLKEDADLELKNINKVYDFLRITKIPNEFEAREIENLKVAGIGRCQLTADMHVSIKAGNKPAAFDWFRDNGRGAQIKEDINPSSLKASIKDAIVKGEQLPEGVFNVSPFTRASINRS